MHFCTKKYQDHKFVHTWNRWNLGVDVLRMLNEHRRLPLELDAETILARLKQKSGYKEDLLKTQKNLAEVTEKKDKIVKVNEKQR